MMLAYSTSHCFLAGNKLGLCLGSEVLIFVLDLRKISEAYRYIGHFSRACERVSPHLAADAHSEVDRSTTPAGL